MLPCVVKSRLHSRQGSPRSSCVSPMSTLDSYSGIPIPSGLLTSFSSNIPTFKPANLPTFFDLSPLLPYPCALCALFCAQQNLISFVFKCCHTLWQKPPGVGVPPISAKIINQFVVFVSDGVRSGLRRFGSSSATPLAAAPLGAALRLPGGMQTETHATGCGFSVSGKE